MPFQLSNMDSGFDNFTKMLNAGIESGKLDRQNEFLKLYRANLKSDGTLPSNFQETANAAGFGNEAIDYVLYHRFSGWFSLFAW